MVAIWYLRKTCCILQKKLKDKKHCKGDLKNARQQNL